MASMIIIACFILGSFREVSPPYGAIYIPIRVGRSIILWSSRDGEGEGWDGINIGGHGHTIVVSAARRSMGGVFMVVACGRGGRIHVRVHSHLHLVGLT